MSKEANLASMLCISRMKEIFGMNGDDGGDKMGTAAESQISPETHCEGDDQGGCTTPSSYGTCINDDDDDNNTLNEHDDVIEDIIIT